jgi:hypothetical protein
MDKIFVSYSRGDSAFVDGLVRDLEERGHPLWVDREDLSVGDSWQARISGAIRECRAFLLILSPASAQSSHVITEVSLADQYRRPIIPILYKKPVIPPGMELYLAGLQYIDLSVVSHEELLTRLDRALSKPAPPPGIPETTRSHWVGSPKRKRTIVTVILVCVALIVVICLCSSLIGSLSY